MIDLEGLLQIEPIKQLLLNYWSIDCGLQVFVLHTWWLTAIYKYYIVIDNDMHGEFLVKKWSKFIAKFSKSISLRGIS